MLLISHRGNVKCPNPEMENRPSYIKLALSKGYNVECDIHYDNGWWLGHDKPQYKTSLEWLNTTPSLFIHCKNINALFRFCGQYINGNVTPHFFYHEGDAATITNHGLIWTLPGKKLTPLSICVLPEKANYTDTQLKRSIGICSDYIERYQNL